MPTEALRYATLLLLPYGLGMLLYGFMAVPLTARPNRGRRGQMRERSLETNSGFRSTELLVRRVAAVLSEVRRTNPWGLGGRLSDLAEPLDQRLVESGYYLGLMVDEYMAMLLLGGVGGGGLGCLAAWYSDSGIALFTVVGAIGGFMALRSQLGNEIEERKKLMTRGLPAALDVAAMCMGAGMDFPGALRQISEGGSERDVVAQEFAIMLRALELGQTRKQALEDMQRRIPADAVRDFARALIQAEEKGNPIADALRIQSSSSRMRRSIMAEEAAARAGVLMIIPMILLFACILILLMGPFMAGGADF